MEEAYQSPYEKFKRSLAKLPSSSESTRMERELLNIRRKQGERSPRIAVMHNRKTMNKVGSLCPALQSVVDD